MDNMIYTPNAGESSEQAISNALGLAVSHGKNVTLNFNGYVLRLTPKSSSVALLNKLSKLIEEDLSRASKMNKYLYRLLYAKWSKRTPSKSGYYWMRDDSGIPVICWYYKEDNSYSLCDMWGKHALKKEDILERGIEFLRCNISFPPVDRGVKKMLNKRRIAI